MKTLVASLFVLSAAFSGRAEALPVRIPEGTEVQVSFQEKISSATAVEGQRFNIETDDRIVLDNGVVIPPGAPGVGEVVSAKKRGFMGQPGELNVRLNYVKIGDSRVKLRASKAAEGKGALGSTVALTVLFGPLGLLKRGANIEIQEGQVITAYVDQDIVVNLPDPSPTPADPAPTAPVTP